MIHHHSSVCLTTGPQPLPNRFLHTVPSSTSYFNCQYPLLSLRSSGSCLSLLLRLPLTSIFPSFFFFNNIYYTAVPMQVLTNLVIRSSFFNFCWIFLSSLTLYVALINFSSDRSNWCSSFFSSNEFQNLPVISYLRSRVVQKVSGLTNSLRWQK